MRPDDPSAHGSNHFVKWANELSFAIADQEAELAALVLESGHQVPGLLGDPGPGRVSRYPGQVDHAAAQVDDEQGIEATQRDRVDVKEEVETLGWIA